MIADFGGTELFPVLIELFSPPKPIGRVHATNRFLFVLTDGDVENPDEVVELVNANFTSTLNKEKGRVEDSKSLVFANFLFLLSSTSLYFMFLPLHNFFHHLKESRVGSASTRVFAIGYGDSASASLVGRLAVAGGGMSEWLSSEEKGGLSHRVMYLLSNVLNSRYR
jgi:hypothetical protein